MFRVKVGKSQFFIVPLISNAIPAFNNNFSTWICNFLVTNFWPNFRIVPIQSKLSYSIFYVKKPLEIHLSGKKLSFICIHPSHSEFLQEIHSWNNFSFCTKNLGSCYQIKRNFVDWVAFKKLSNFRSHLRWETRAKEMLLDKSRGYLLSQRRHQIRFGFAKP